LLVSGASGAGTIALATFALISVPATKVAAISLCMEESPLKSAG
jgi:hypothetical protein